MEVAGSNTAPPTIKFKHLQDIQGKKTNKKGHPQRVFLFFCVFFVCFTMCFLSILKAATILLPYHGPRHYLLPQEYDLQSALLSQGYHFLTGVRTRPKSQMA